MQLLPAIDIRNGRVVRLYEGDFMRETVFPFDPLQLAARYAEAGAEWLHVVDLDGARYGSSRIGALLEGLVRSGLRLQVGGGVRQESDVQRLLEAGAMRVVVGSVAVREPERVCGWLQRFCADHITIALDVRWDNGVWRATSEGWLRKETATLDDLALLYQRAGARQILCTDISRDGTLRGPNFALYAHLRNLAPALDIQVSGGVRDLDDIRTARAYGATAVVLGRALLEGRITLTEALAC